MANHKSALKTHIQSTRKRLRNRSVESAVASSIKKVEGCTSGKSDYSTACSLLAAAQSTIMQAVRKGVLKLNNASRKISRLAHIVKRCEQNHTKTN